MILPGLEDAISSGASADGNLRCNTQAGQLREKSGREVALVNHSRRPESEKEPTINATCGPNSCGSLQNADLQQCLENRLQVHLGVNGSPEYVLTWKHWDMKSGQPICALRASVLRTSDKDSGGVQGYPTPTCPSKTNGHQAGNNRFVSGMMEIVKGWNTPRATDGKNGGPSQAGGALPADAATMGHDGVLNPELSRWLMGFPDGWTSYAGMAMPSFLN